MRVSAAVLALTATFGAGAACAQGSVSESGPDVRTPMQTFTVSAGAVKQAKDAVAQALNNPAGISFRKVRSLSVASVRHSPFEAPIEGPVSLICGQFSIKDSPSGDAWFFVPIKRGKVLWTTLDGGTPGTAFNSCHAAGLTDSPRTSMPDE